MLSCGQMVETTGAGLPMPNITFCDVNPYSAMKLAALRPDLFPESVRQALAYRNISRASDISPRDWDKVMENLLQDRPTRQEAMIMGRDENYLVSAILGTCRSFMQPMNVDCCRAWMNKWRPMADYDPAYEPDWVKINAMIDAGVGCVPDLEPWPKAPGFGDDPDADDDCETISGCEALLTESLHGACNGNQLCDRPACLSAARRLQLWLQVTSDGMAAGTMTGDDTVAARLEWINAAVDKCDRGIPVGRRLQDVVRGNTSVFDIDSDYLDGSRNVDPSSLIPFYPILDPQYGVCYQTRLDNPLIAYSPGVDSSARIELAAFVNTEDYMPNTPVVGTVVTIHDAGQLARPGGRSIYVPKGSTAYVGFHQVRIERLDEPYGHCKEGAMSKDMCVYVRIYQYQERQCGCRNYFEVDYITDQASHVDPSLPDCVGQADWTCINDAKKYADEHIPEVVGDTCVHEPCTEITYEVKLQGALPTSDGYILKQWETRMANSPKSAQDSSPLTMEADVSTIRMAYDDMLVVRYTDEAKMSLLSLIGGVGGYFGLFVGMSIISFVEVLQVFFILSGRRTHKVGRKLGRGLTRMASTKRRW